MSLDDRVFEILTRWTAAREQGLTLSIEQLCADCPELADEVRGRIKMLQAMDWLENSDDGSNPPAPLAQPHQTRPATHDLANEPTIGITPGADQRPPEVGSYVRYVGDYELLAEIARGGMGVVFKARQVRLKRVVAVKMILAGRLASENEVRRFHTEAEAAANLEHPHIVPIFEVGEQKGLHYFSMGYVDGQSLAARLADGPLPSREAATILRPVAEAVHYAHQRGVIHRDLKPGNILIDKHGQPRVTDFGLAKRVSADASEMTGTGQILGTASYMPPEQALGQPSLVREPADIYSLGAVLYAMLTGRPPFQADNPVETLRQVIEREPVPPRQLNPAIPADLETICLKCLEKSASRRYATAQDVADELGRFLEGKPILARPVSTLNRAWRWCQRNRTIASLLTAVAASLVIGTAVSSYFAIESNQRATDNLQLAQKNLGLAQQEQKAKQEAEARRGEAQAAQALAEQRLRESRREAANFALNQAAGLNEDKEANLAALWTVKAHGMALEANDPKLMETCRAMLSGCLAHVPRRERFVTSNRGTVAVYGAKDETVLICASGPRSSARSGLEIRDARTLEVLDHIPDVFTVGNGLAIDRDRKRLLLQDRQKRIRMWSLENRDWVGDVIRPAGEVDYAAFSPRRDLLATMTIDATIEFFSAATGQPTGVKIVLGKEGRTGSSWHWYRFCFNGPGHLMYAGGSGHHDLKCFDVNNGAMMPGWPRKMPRDISAYAAAPQGGLVALSIPYHHTQVNWENGEFSMAGQEAAQNPWVRALAYSPDGRWLVETGSDNRLAFRDGTNASVLATAFSNVGDGWEVQFSQDSARVLASFDQSVELWQAPAVITETNRRARQEHLRPKRFRLNGKLVGIDDGSIVAHLADRGSVATGESTIVDLPEGTIGVRATPDERHLVAMLPDGLAVIDAQTGETTRSPEVRLPEIKSAAWMWVSKDGTRAVTSSEATAQVWELPTALPLGSPITMSAAPEGAPSAAAVIGVGTIADPRFSTSRESSEFGILLDTQQGLFQIHRLRDAAAEGPPLELGPVLRVEFHPDGQHLVLLRDAAVELWDRKSKRTIRNITPPGDRFESAIVSPQGDCIATVGRDSVIRIYDIATGSLLGLPMRRVGTRVHATFSPDGRWLAAQGLGTPVYVIHVASGRQVTPPLNIILQTWNLVRAFTFSRDSKALLNPEYGYAFPLITVPEDHEQLALFVESWSGLTLDGNDIRVLKPDDWESRCRRLREGGWKDDLTETEPLVGPKFDPERDLARWVLGGFGELRITNVDGNRAITRLQDVPEKAFNITAITLTEKKPFDASQMPNLHWPSRLELLRVRGPSFNDHVLLKMRNLPWLRRVYLANTSSTDKGLARLADFPTIEHLEVDGAHHTAQWLPGVAVHGKLKALAVRGPQVDDDGLESLSQCPNLLILALGDRVTDESCEAISELPNLRTLTLKGAITPDGVKKLAGCKRLSYLGLNSQTTVDAETLKTIAGTWSDLHTIVLGDVNSSAEATSHLSKFDKARLITLGRGPTKAALTKLSESLPACHIVSAEHGKFGPESPADSERVAAAWALKDNGEIEALIGDSYQSGKSATVSSKGLVRVHAVKLSASAPVHDVSQLSVCNRLYSLEAPSITDAAGPSLATLTSLERLVLNKSKVSDAILEHLAKLPQLADLNLAECKVTDEGLKQLAGCERLKTLDLRKTGVTTAGVEALQVRLPDCSIVVDKP